jgi:hypothetical protein
MNNPLLIFTLAAYLFFLPRASPANLSIKKTASDATGMHTIITNISLRIVTAKPPNVHNTLILFYHSVAEKSRFFH